MSEGTAVVVVVITASSGELKISVQREDRAGTDQEPLTAFRMKIADLLQRPGKDAACKVGARVLAAFAHTAQKDLGSIGYTELANQAKNIVDKDLYRRVDDSASAYDLALDKMLESVQVADEAMLDLAERYLRDAARAGNQSAETFLEVFWPIEKEVRTSMIRAAKRRRS